MDLFFKNTPYFMSVYLDFPLWKYLITVAVCYSLLHLFLYFIVKATLRKTIFLSIVFSLYCALLIGMTLLGSNRSGVTGIIADPFYGIKKVILEGNVHFLRGMLSNILFFVPCGVFYRTLNYKYNFIKGLFFSLLISVSLETFQYILSVGYFETSDIFCNVVGMLVGMGITELGFLFINNLKNKKQAKE